MWFLIDAPAALSRSILSIVTTGTIVDNSAHVPTFYAPIAVVSDTVGLLFFVLPVAAILFGGLHCICWNFDFPTDIEQLLWRVGSLAITSIPSILFVFGLIANYSYTTKPMWLRVMSRTLARFLLVAYMLARLLLLTQAIVLLRKQPGSAFYVINWSDFLPHI